MTPDPYTTWLDSLTPMQRARRERDRQIALQHNDRIWREKMREHSQELVSPDRPHCVENQNQSAP